MEHRNPQTVSYYMGQRGPVKAQGGERKRRTEKGGKGTDAAYGLKHAPGGPGITFGWPHTSQER